MNHDRHHSLVVDAIEAAISGSPGEEFLRAWFNKFRLSEIKEEDAEAELYKRQHSKGTGNQDLDIHGLKAEEMLLKRADEFAKLLSWEEAATGLPRDPNAGFGSFGLTKGEVLPLSIDQAQAE